MTNVTAAPMPSAELIFFDTPRKGHTPRNWERTILLMNIAVMMIDMYVSMAVRLYVFC